jgi:predicted nucleotidyltransferase
MTTHELIELVGRRLADAAASPARVILFGSAARGELTRDSDLDFLVIEREVENRVAEAVRLRDAIGRIGWPVDVIVMDEDLAARRAKVRGTMVHHALREGRVVAGGRTNGPSGNRTRNLGLKRPLLCRLS